MADEADYAQEIEEHRLKHVLSSRVVYSGESAEFCVDCDEPIPEKRREIIQGVQLCVECAGR